MDVCSNESSCVQTITWDISGLDSDLDGVPDYDECVAGTSPTDVNSYLRLGIQWMPPGALLTFTSLSSRVYTIEYQPELSNNAAWPVLTNLPGTGDNMTVPDPDSANQRFYRIKARIGE
jgi:hypothetical protein